MSELRRELLRQLAAGQVSPEEAAGRLAHLDGVTRRPPTPPEPGPPDRELALSYLRALLGETIKLEPARIDAEAPLTDYGLDSLMAVRLTRSLEERLGSLPKTLFFEFSTLADLADYLLAEHPHSWVDAGRPRETFEPRRHGNGTLTPERESQTQGIAARTLASRDAESAAGDGSLEIAIVGLAGRFPGANTLGEFWENLRQGRDCVTVAPTERGLGQVRGGFLDDVTRFDAEFFGIAPREAKIMDPQERLFLECAYHALEDAGALSLRGGAVGVFAGVMYQEHAFHGVEETLRGRPVSLSSNAATIANRVSYALDLHGPSLACDTMCSSSMTALHLACASLRRGECVAALAGGVNLWLHSNRSLTLAQGRFGSVRGRCAAFGEEGDGYVPGEAVAVALLKPLERALAEGDHIYAVIEGSALNHGGRSNGYTVPSPRSQAAAIAAALRQAGVDAVDYLEAHGTGTALGDPIEIEGLTRAYRGLEGPCPIGSVKSNIGHCESAAGMASLCKVLLQLRHHELVPSLHCQQLNANIDFSRTPFRVQRQSTPWPRGEKTRRAGISSFGAGGANAHLVLREGPLPKPALEAGVGTVAIVLSAATPRALQQRARELWESLELIQPGQLENLAYTLQLGREMMTERLGLVVSSLPELSEALQAFAADQQREGVHRGVVNRESRELFADPELQAALHGMLERRHYHRLLQLWTQGVEVDWRRLYSQPLSRLSLPLYPFGGDRHWLPASKTSHGLGSSLHPWLGASLPDLDGPRFALTFQPTDAVLADHQLHQRPLLPAVVLLEMARAALALATGEEKAVRLCDVVWARPLFVEQPTRVETCLWREDGGQILFEMLRDAETVCWGRGSDFEGEAPEADDLLSRIRELSACGQAVAGEDLYERLAGDGLSIAHGQRGLLRWWRHGEHALAELTDPQSGREPVDLPRGILDGALHAVAAFAQGAGEPARLPFALDELVVLGRCSSQMLALLRQREDAYDLTLSDPQGHAAVLLRGLRLRPASNRSELLEESPQHPELLMLAPAWEAAAARSEVPPCPNRLVLGVGLPVQGPKLAAQQLDELVVEAFELLQSRLRENVRTPLRVQAVVAESVGEIAANALSGMLKSAVKEFPQLTAQVVRWQERAENLTESLEAEARSADVDVRYREGRREVLRWREVSAPEDGFGWIQDEVVVISGGAGGLGLIVAEDIARQAPGARIVLAGRSELGARESRLQALRELGPEVHYAQIDISNAEQVETLVAETVGRWGRLDVVIHAAGVLRDSLLLRKSPADLRLVWSTKMDGLRALDRATAKLPLRAFVIFSSASGALGNAGQCDYASANAGMDAFAARRQRSVAKGERHGNTLSLNWPLWAEGGMSVPEASVRRMREQIGLRPMQSSTGLLALRQALSTGLVQVMPLEGEVDRLRDAFVGQPSGARTPPEPAPPDDPLLDYLRGQLARVSGLASERIRAEAALEEVGLDSVMVLEMTEALERDFGRLPKTLLFEHPTLSRLASYLKSEHGPVVARLAPRPVTGLATTGPIAPTSVAPSPCDARGAAGQAKPGQRQPRRKTARRPRAAVAEQTEVGPLRIAIIGLAGSYAQSPDLDTLWRNLRQGRDLITPIPEGRWPQTHYPPPQGAWGGFLDEVADFDPFFFGIAPAEAEILDPQERLFLQTAYHALEDGGYRRRPMAPEGARVGVFVGVMNGEYELYGVEQSALGRPLALSSHAASIANRVSYFCNFRGPCLAVDSMCSSSLTAVHLACQSLRRGECEMALAGGVNLSLHPNKYLMLAQGRFTSSQGRCAAFGEGGDGYVPGEGVGAVLLKPLERALADGDAIHAVIQGSALNHGGKTNGYSVPNPWAQSLVIEEALRQSGFSAAQIGYLEAHGTGTSLGDPIEIAGLARAFAAAGGRHARCPIGSVKSNLGHCEGAAGMAALSKVLLQMRHGELVPSLHADTLNPHIDFASTPFTVARQLQHWPRPSSGPRVCGISSFGAGGSNAHVILEEAPSQRLNSASSHGLATVFPLSARRREDLPAVAGRLAEAVSGNEELRLDSVAFTLQAGRESLEHRVVLRARDRAELLKALRDLVDGRVPPAPGEKVAESWLVGRDIDWESLWSPLKPGRAHLPGYPFQKIRCWAPGPAEPPHQPRRVSLPAHTVLADHMVSGQQVLPAACTVELLLEVAGPAPLAFENLVWLRPLTGHESLAVRRRGKPEQLELLAHESEPCCRARLGEARSTPVPTLSLEKLEAACAETLNPTELYRDLAGRGLEHGPSYRVITQLRRGAEQLLARLELPNPASPGSLLPAALLDGVFQSSLALSPVGDGPAGMVFSLRSLVVLDACPPNAWAVVSRGSNGFDFSLCDDRGEVKAVGAGLVLKAPLARRDSPLPRAPLSTPESEPLGLEEILLERVAATLRVPVEALDQSSPFADFGLDSITGVGLLEELNELLGLELAVTALFEHNSTALLAQHIRREWPQAVRALQRSSTPSIGAEKSSGLAAVSETRAEHPVAPTPFVHQNHSPGVPEPIAIIGMSGRFAQSPDLSALWHHLEAGHDLVEPVARWELPGCHGSLLQDIDAFDPLFFRISAVEAAYMDPQQRIFLEECWKALEEAGYAGDAIRGCRCGVFAGVHENDYDRLFEGELPAQAVWGNMAAVIPSRIAYHLDLRGPSMVVDTACSSSLVAVHLACQSLWSGETDLALAGGVAVRCTTAMWENGKDAGMVSPSGRCYTFDARADGFVPGEGAAVVVLKPLARALADGDTVRAVLRGSGVNQDGASNGLTAPSAAAQERLEREVHERFGIDIERVGLVEAHGSATPLGDPIEVEALTRAFRARTARTGFCALGSIKSNLGHTVASAGIAGLVKAVLALEHRRLPATVHYQIPNPKIQLENSPFYINTETLDWPAPASGPRCALISSFGASGTNAHLVVEEAPPTASWPHQPQGPTAGRLLMLSARTADQLMLQVQRLADHLEREPQCDLEAVAYTLASGRRHLAHRLACIASTGAEAVRILRGFLSGTTLGVWHGEAQPNGNVIAAELSLESQAAQYLEGRRPWVAPSGRRVPLPTYPFARDRYWAKQTGPLEAPRTATHEANNDSMLLHQLKTLLSQVTGYPYESIDETQPNELYGLDSLMIGQLNEALAERFPSLSRSLFFECGSLAEVAAHLRRKHQDECAQWVGVQQQPSTPATPATPARRRAVAPLSLSRAASSLSASSASSLSASSLSTSSQSEPIAIIGLSGKYPGAGNPDELWEALREGRSAIGEIPDERWSMAGFLANDPETAAASGRSYSRWGGFLEGFADFDPLFFRISPREAASMDPQERLFLTCCWEALEDAACTPAMLRQRHSGKVGVFVGVTKQGLSLHSVDAWRQGSLTYPRTSFGSIANRVSYLLDLQGPSMPVDTLCSSSLTALHQACEHLRRGECELALAGGVNLYLHPLTYIELCTQQMLSPDGVCRAFAAGANGFVPGEGVGAVLLKPLSAAVRDGDPIHALIRGSAINHDGKTNGYTVPNPVAQTELIRETLRKAGASADEVSYVEAHGTGTALGDPIEVTGLTEAFRADTDRLGFCALGSIKANIGHLEAAAGIAGLTKVLLQLRHRTLAPTLHSRKPSPDIPFASTPFHLPQEARSWETPNGRPRLAGLSSFGAGGSNAHLLIQEAPPQPSGQDSGQPCLVVISANTAEQLRESAQRLLDFSRQTRVSVDEIAYTLQVGRVALEHRLALVVPGRGELAQALEAYLGGRPTAGLYQGQAAAGRGALSRLSPTELNPLLRDWLERGQLERLAELWVEGARLDWEQLHAGRERPSRRHLPTYPFARERFWEPPAAGAAPGQLHPLLQENISQLGRQAFRACFDGTEPFLRDHRVQEQAVMPAAAWLEMGREAVTRSLGLPPGAPLVLREVAFLRPLTIEDERVTVEVVVTGTHGEGARFRIQSPRGVHCEGWAEPSWAEAGATQTQQFHDSPLSGVELCPRQLYQSFEQIGVIYGPALRAVRALRKSGTVVEVDLELPGRVWPRGFSLHPALLDAATQAIPALFPQGPARPMLPFSLEKLEFFAPFPPRMRALVRGHGDSFDLELTDEKGGLLARLQGLLCREARPAGTATQLLPIWDPIEVQAEAALGLSVGEPLPGLAGLNLRPEQTVQEMVDILSSSRQRLERLVLLAPEPGPDAGESSRKGTRLLFRLLKALLALGYHEQPLSLVVLTRGAFAVLPEDRIEPWQAGLHGLLGSVSEELPLWSTRVVDLPVEGELRSEWLEVPAGRGGGSWAWRDGQWYEQRLLPLHLGGESQASPLARAQDEAGDDLSGPTLILGGAGGLGQVYAEHLLRKGAGPVILAGRRAPDALEPELRQLATLGQVEYHQLDAGDAAAVATLLADLRHRHGRLRAVVHSVLVLADRSLAEMDEALFESALEAKRASCLALAETLPQEPPRQLLFFSSMIAFQRAAGQCNYAAGTVFADACAAWLQRRLPDCRVKVMNWGFWGRQGVVATSEYRSRLARRGVESISAQEGMAALEALLAGPFPRLGYLKTREPLPATEVAIELPRPEDGSGQARCGEPVRSGVLTTLAELLGLEVEALEPELSLRELGVDPLVLARLERGGPESATWSLDLTLAELAGQSSLQSMPVPSLPASDLADAEAFESLLARLLACQLAKMGVRRMSALPLGLAPLQWGQACAPYLGRAGRLHGDQLVAEEAEHVWSEWRRRCQAWSADPDRLAQLRMAEHALRALPDVLEGRLSATEMLFPDGSSSLVEGLYRDNRLSDFFNSAVAQVVKAELTRRRTPLKILEVGAGTGGTTTALLNGGLVGEGLLEYAFTDLSPALLEQARQAFGAACPAMTFRRLDITRAVEEQGFPLGSYDLVLATNVLHATPDIRRSLRNAKALLRSGGCLVLNEMTSGSLFTHLTFGLLEAWWKVDDPALRQPGCPALSPGSWRRVLQDCGFLGLTFPTEAAHAHGQQVIFAYSDGLIRQPRPSSPTPLAAVEAATSQAPSSTATPPASPPALAASDRTADWKATARARMHDLAAQALGMDASRLDPRQPLEAYGMDSIMAVTLTNSLRRLLPDLKTSAVFGHDTLASLVDDLIASRSTQLRSLLETSPSPAAETQSRPRPGESKAEKPGPFEVAVVGLAGRYPGARHPQELWRLLSQGRDAISEVPADRWDWRPYFDARKGVRGRVYTPWGGFLETIAEFDPLFFGISPAEAEDMDPQERLFLQEAFAAIEDAGHTPTSLSARGSVGVFVGVMNSHYRMGPDYWSIANRVSYTLDLRGPSLAVDSACSSSLSAIHLALESLASGSCRAALAGGVNLISGPTHLLKLSAMTMLTPEARNKTFSAAADGFVDGEGVGVVVLKPLPDALRDGDQIYGVLRGSMLNSGGKTHGYTVPNPRAQAEVIEGALRRAGVSARELSYLEAHGTGTALGDPIEIAGLSRAFAADTEDRGFCAIGSLKSNIGHGESAAGIAGLTKILLQLRHGQLVPTLHCDPPNPEIPWEESPFHLQRELAPWPGQPGSRVAGLSSFGAGGANAHLVVAEGPVPVARGSDSLGGPAKDRPRPYLFLLSGRDQRALSERIAALLAWTYEHEGKVALADIAFTLAVGRLEMSERLAFLASSYEELRQRLSGTGTVYRGQALPAASAATSPEGLELRELALRWVEGASFRWEALYASRPARRVSLPTYPFARERYWAPGWSLPATPSPSAPAPSLEGDDPQAIALAALKEAVSHVLKLPVDHLLESAPLEEIGFNSIMAVEATRRLEERFGSLPSTLFFEARDLRGLALHLVAAKGDLLTQPSNPTISLVRPQDSDPIAIIGLAGRYPEADSLDELWANLLKGRDCISEIPAERWEHSLYYDPDPGAEGKTYARWAGLLRGVDLFDARFFGITPHEAELMDPQERLFLECIQHVLDDAGLTRRGLGPEVGVFVGVMSQEYQLFGAASTAKGQPLPLSASPASIANRVSYAFDFQGPSLVCDSMCSSSLTAIHLACQALRSGQCQAAVAGGVNLCLHPNKLLLLGSTRFASSDGRCRAFGEGGDGYVPAEGVGAVLLKPLSKALADGDRIYAVVRGSAVNHGGRTNGYTVPNPEAQAAVIERAYRESGVDPRSVSYVEAHGTGTPLGDPIELSALTRAFERLGRAGADPCALGSIKSNLGHCEGAAGIAGLTKILLQMKHGRLVPGLHAERINPRLDFNGTPFRLQRAAADWPRHRRDGLEQPRVAGISGFGAGGSNAHLVVEEYLEPIRHRKASAAPQLVPLSARDANALQELLRLLRDWLERHADTHLEDIALTLTQGRLEMAERVAFVVNTTAELRVRLDRYLGGDLSAADGRGRVVREGQRLSGAEPAQEAATRWAQGESLAVAPFPEARRLRLPGYPFARERFWAPAPGIESPAQAIAPALKPGRRADLHPLVQRRLSPDTFASTFDGRESFLADHRVGGCPVLPAAALLEMARATVALARPGESLALEDVVFLRPLKVEREREVQVRLREQPGESLDFSIVGDDDELYCRGAARPCPVVRQAYRLDLESLRRQCSLNRPNVDELYRSFDRLGLEYGPSHRRLREVFTDSEQVLSQLNGSLTRHMVLEPGLLDGALQSILALGHSEGLPFSLRRLRVLGPCTSPMWSRLTRRSNGEVDLELADDSGQLLASIEGLKLRAAAAPESLFLAQPRWVARPTGQGELLPDRLVVLCGVQAPGLEARHLPWSGHNLGESFRQAAIALAELLRSIPAQGPPLLVQLIVPGRGLDGCARALSAMLTTAAQENSRLRPQTLAWDDPADPALWLAENARSPQDAHIRYHNGLRQTLALEELEPVGSSRRPWRDGGVYLISGGAGGLGRIFAREIASSVRSPVLILIGRSPRAEDLESLRQTGARVEYHSQDLSDETGLRTLLQDVRRRWGGIHGVLHSAGVTRDSLLFRKSAQEISEVLGPKVDGLIALDQSTVDDPLDLFVAFSSVSAFAGNAGQADYAAANAFMDAYLQWRAEAVTAGRRKGLSCSINWPLWREGGMQVGAAREAALWEMMGMRPLASGNGLRAFYRVLGCELPQALVVEGDRERLRRSMLVSRGTDHTAVSASPGLRKDLLEIVSEVSGMAPDTIPWDEPLQSLGLNSVMAVEATSRLSELLGPISSSLFFEHDTLEQLLAALPAQPSRSSSPPPAPQTSLPESHLDGLLELFLEGSASLEETLDALEGGGR